ncbi:pyridoxal phosphate-dependent transferase [Aspergillus lucknowensis]|uniref:Pyridoxal phosphate-dependent transferase n=1 Tax=Aspergillus lucknowensis TaxID=176173 RepID=A0ABR4LN48_9EURO
MPEISTSSVFHRSLTQSYDSAASGSGVYVQTKDGKKVLDGCSGATVSCLGHGHPKIIQAIVDQVQNMAYAHTSLYTSDPAEKLAALLTEQSDDAFSKVMFLCSGSEAVESSIKLVRQYHICNGQPDRINFISREHSYHRNTLGALAAGYSPDRRTPFAPLLSPAFHHVSPCFFSRDGKPSGEDEATYVRRLLDELGRKFLSLGARTVAGMLIEPIIGATIGSLPAAAGYLAGVREICDRHGALLMYDEVMCGMGRSGTLHAWQSLGLGNVALDIQAIGKGLGGVHDAIQAGQESHPLVSGHTYQGHSIGCAAALAAMGSLLQERLRSLTPCLKEVRGRGLFVTVAARAFINGAAVYHCARVVDAILFAPPFIITADEVERLVRIFTTSVLEVVQSRRA